MNKFLYDLGMGVLSGVISGLILSWIFKAELKKILSAESFKRILSKEIFLVVAISIFFIGYGVLVKKGIIPPYEFRDDVVLYDMDGNECVKDLFHPERGCKPTGRKVRSVLFSKDNGADEAPNLFSNSEQKKAHIIL